MTLTDFGLSCLDHLVYISALPKLLYYLSCQYQMNFIPKTRHAHYVRHSHFYSSTKRHETAASFQYTIMAFLGGEHPELSTCEGCFPEGFSPRENNPHKLTILDVHRLRWP